MYFWEERDLGTYQRVFVDNFVFLSVEDCISTQRSLSSVRLSWVNDWKQQSTIFSCYATYDAS